MVKNRYLNIYLNPYFCIIFLISIIFIPCSAKCDSLQCFSGSGPNAAQIKIGYAVKVGGAKISIMQCVKNYSNCWEVASNVVPAGSGVAVFNVRFTENSFRDVPLSATMQSAGCKSALDCQCRFSYYRNP